MHTFWQIIKETVRIFPAAPGIIRQCTEDVVVSGYKVFAHTDLHVSIIIITYIVVSRCVSKASPGFSIVSPQ